MSKKKWHVKSDGTGKGECKAEVRECPLLKSDPDAQHFSSEKEVKEFETCINESKHGIVHTMNSTIVREKNQKEAKDFSNKFEKEACLRLAERGVSAIAVEKEGIVLSDVDGTVVKGSLVLGHAVWLAKHGHAPEVYGDIPDRWLADQKSEELITELAIAYQKSLKGKHMNEVGMDEYLDEVLSNRQNFYSTIERLEEHRDRGDRVILVSGSPDYMVKKMAERFGFEAEGSVYDVNNAGVFSGSISRPMFHSDAKRAYVSSLNLNHDEHYVTSYGDTASDVPLFESSQHSVLIDPHDETMSTIGHMVNEVFREH